MICGEGIQETLIRECAEEASIPEELARMATTAGCVRYFILIAVSVLTFPALNFFVRCFVWPVCETGRFSLYLGDFPILRGQKIISQPPCDLTILNYKSSSKSTKWGGTGGQNLLLPIPLSPDSLPVSQAVCLPILIAIYFDLSKTKNWIVKQTTPHSPVRSFKWRSLDASLHHVVKSFFRSLFRVVWSKLPLRPSMYRTFTASTKNTDAEWNFLWWHRL